MPIQTHVQKSDNVKLQRWIAMASALLLLVKFAAYYVTQSVSILTDALESIVNVAAGFIGLYSLQVSARPRDADHPYGHGKAEFISAAVEGTLVLSAGAIIIYSAVKNLVVPPQLARLDVGMILIGSTAVINWLLGYAAHRQGTRNGSLALMASGRHLQVDSYSTVALIAGLFFTHLYRLDVD